MIGCPEIPGLFRGCTKRAEHLSAGDRDQTWLLLDRSTAANAPRSASARRITPDFVPFGQARGSIAHSRMPAPKREGADHKQTPHAQLRQLLNPMSGAKGTVQGARNSSYSSLANFQDEELAFKGMVRTREPTFPLWVHPSGPRSPSFVRCGLRGGQRTRGYGSVPRKCSRQTEPTSRRALWPRCAARQRDVKPCTQTAEPGVATL